MDITIIIVNWNGGELLRKCLRSIRDSKQSFKVNVIVVDNDSIDGSRETASAEFPQFTVINSGANLGFGRANNLAKSMVETPLVLFLNPDTELKPDTLENVASCIHGRERVGIVGCKMLYSSGQVQDLGVQWYPSLLTVILDMVLDNRFTRGWLPGTDPNRSSEVKKLYGGFLLCRKEVLDAAGWFDDRYFMYAEDVDLSRTVTDLGWKLYYCSEAEIIHDHGGVSAKAPSGFAILMKNQSINQYLRKYHGHVAAFLHRPLLLVSSIAKLLALVIRRTLPCGRKGPHVLQWRESLFKQKLMIQWSLGLKNAGIPRGGRCG